MGYQKVLDIMRSDQALTDAGTNFASGEAVYTIAIFGEPGAIKPWMLEFGGHHLGLNIVIDGSSGIYEADSHSRAAVRLQAATRSCVYSHRRTTQLLVCSTR
jgi:uncharacterized protein DUF3500